MTHRLTTAQELVWANLRGHEHAPSKRLVRPVAKRRGFGLFAPAQRDFFFFIHGKLKRFKSGSLMRPITERLIPRAPASAPVVGSRLQRNHGRLFGCNAWLSHECSSLWMIEMKSRG